MIDFTKTWKSLTPEERQELSEKHGISDEDAYNSTVDSFLQENQNALSLGKDKQASAFTEYLDNKANARNAGVQAFDYGQLGNTIAKGAESVNMMTTGANRLKDLEGKQPSFETLRSNPLLQQQLNRFALKQEQGSPLFVRNALDQNVRDLQTNERNNAAYYGGQSGISGAMNQAAVLNKNMGDRAAFLSNEDIKAQAADQLNSLIGQQQQERAIQSQQGYARYLQDLENYRNKLSGAQNLAQIGKANLMDIGEQLPYQTANLVQHNYTTPKVQQPQSNNPDYVLARYSKYRKPLYAQ